MSKNSVTAAYLGVLGLLGVAFVVLRLCRVINWSWWLVTAPFWGPLGLTLLLAAVFVVCGFVTYVVFGDKL